MVEPLVINPTCDPAALAPAFARTGRLHIPDFFEKPAILEAGRSVAEDLPWTRLLNDGVDHVATPRAAFDALPPEQRRQMQVMPRRGAQGGFGFAYDAYPLADEIGAGRRLGVAAEAVFDALNDAAFLDFVRNLTGDCRASVVDAQATRYGPGDFLTEHSDEAPAMKRLYAYVLNLTPRWRTDWGGILTFTTPDGHVAEGYAPRFNALNIFRVPQPHFVGEVASYAGAYRYAVTGWIRMR